MNLSDDDYTLFGLRPRFGIEASELDQRWRDLQAQVHPDRHAAQGSAGQRLAMQWSVRVNEAYRRLKDPLSRAAYLCELRGVAIEAESNTRMPADFLMQQMSWRESLDDAGDADAIDALEREVRAAGRSMQDRLKALLDEEQDATAAAAVVRSMMFVQRFLKDVAVRAEALAS